jgi:hypothetical protein
VTSKRVFPNFRALEGFCVENIPMLKIQAFYPFTNQPFTVLSNQVQNLPIPKNCEPEWHRIVVKCTSILSPKD